MNKLILVPIALPALLFSAAPATAQPGIIHTREVVSYADLNLGTPGGRAMLDRRLSTAINHACGYRPQLSWNETVNVNRCRREARLQVAPARAAALAGALPSRSIQVATTR